MWLTLEVFQLDLRLETCAISFVGSLSLADAEQSAQTRLSGLALGSFLLTNLVGAKKHSTSNNLSNSFLHIV